MNSPDQRPRLAELALPALAAAAVLLLAHTLLLRQNTPNYDEQLASLLLQSGRTDDAIAAYQSALHVNPASATAPVGLALAWAARGDNLQAQRILEQSLKLHPGDAPTYEALADLAVKSLGDLALPAAQKYWETAIHYDPTRASAALGLSKIYLAQNRLLDAGRVLVKPLAAHDRNAALHLQMAAIYALLGYYDRASDEFDTGTARDPENSKAYCDWGIMLIDAGKYEKAEFALRRALELQPDNPLYHMHLARALRNRGLFTEAMNEFSTALDKDIRCVPVYRELAWTFQDMHDDKSAENFLRQGVAANPASAEAKIALATLLTTTTDPLRRNLWEAATLVQTCVDDTHEQNADLLAAAAEAWARVEMHDRALELIEKAIAWARLHDVDPGRIEKLLSSRQRYAIALAESVEEKTTGTSFSETPVDVPWPEPRQPRIETLIDKPLRLSRPPAPGSALDPALYVNDALEPPVQGFPQ